MTSVDSGIETGNDSNDSGQAESQSILFGLPSSNGVISDQKWDQKRFLHNLATAFVEMKKISEDNQNESESVDINIDDTATPTTIVCRTNPIHLSPHFTLEACTSAPSIDILPLKKPSTLDFVLPQRLRVEKQSWMVFSKAPWAAEKGEFSKKLVRKLSRSLKWQSQKFCKDTSQPFYGSTWARKMRLAAATNNIELMTHLLYKGISPNNADEQGRTPLHLACSRGYTDMVKLLLDHGADPNMTDTLGNTPLHLAAVTSKIPVVTLLLKAGTNVLSSDRHGYNPLQLAQTKLRMLQNCKGSDMTRIKEEVHKVVGMLLAYLQKQKDVTQQIEALSSFCSRLSLSNTTDQVQGDVKDLLASIDSLSLTN